MLLLGFVTLLKDEIEDLEKNKVRWICCKLGYSFVLYSKNSAMIIVELIGRRWFPTQYQCNNLLFVSVWYFVQCKLERIKKLPAIASQSARTMSGP